MTKTNSNIAQHLAQTLASGKKEKSKSGRISKTTLALFVPAMLGYSIAQAQAVSEQEALAVESANWYSDPAFIEKTKRRLNFNFRKWLSYSVVKVENVSDFDSAGQHRLVMKTKRVVLNADGYTEQGFPFINLCEEAANCSFAAEQQQRFKVSYRFKWTDLFYFRAPQVELQSLPYQVQLLHAADMDGTSGALENVKPFSAILDSLRSEYPDNTLTLSSGDNYIPGPRYAASADDSLNSLLGIAGEGRADIGFLNTMGFQASAMGNHELDGGTAALANIIGEEANDVAVYPGSQFPYLSANLDFSLDVNLAPLVTVDGNTPDQMKSGLARYTVIPVAGERIGVVGATTPNLAEITNTGDIGILPTDGDDIAALAAEIQKAVDELKGQGINKIILLAHMQQIAIEKQLAALLDGVDIIVAGGSNTLLADSNDALQDGDVAADTYPLSFQSSSGQPVLVVNTDGDYKYLGRLVSQFDLQGQLILERLDAEVNGAYAANKYVLEQLGNPDANSDVEALADALVSVLADRDGNIFGRASVYLDGRRGQVRTQETNLGNLTADANLWTAQQADASVVVSIKNGGGIRDDIGYFAFPPGSTNPDDLEFFPTAPNAAAGKQEGDVSQFDIQNSLRFNNGLALLTVTAAELAAIVEHGVAATEEGAAPGRFPQVSGMKFSFDPSLTPGQRIQNLVILSDTGEVSDVVVRAGVLEGDVTRTFRIVTLGFLANGGDGFPFPQGSEANRVDLPGAGLLEEGIASFADAGSEQDSLAEYLAAIYAEIPYNSVETIPELDQRIQNLSMKSQDTVLD